MIYQWLSFAHVQRTRTNHPLLLIPGNEPAPWRHIIVVNKHYLPSFLPVIRIMKGRRSHRRCHRHWQLLHLFPGNHYLQVNASLKKGKRHETWQHLIYPKRNRDGHFSLSHLVSFICVKRWKLSPRKQPDLRSIHICDLLSVNYCVNFSVHAITKNDYKFNIGLRITISCGTISWWIDLGCNNLQRFLHKIAFQ